MVVHMSTPNNFFSVLFRLIWSKSNSVLKQEADPMNLCISWEIEIVFFNFIPFCSSIKYNRSCWQGFNKWYLKLSHVTSLSKGLTRVGVVHFPIRVRMLSWEWINGLPFSVLVTIFFFFSQRMSYQNFNVLYNLWIISLCSTALTFSTYSNLIE